MVLPSSLPLQMFIVYLILVYVPTQPLGVPRRRREDNIQMDLKGTGWEGMD